MAKSTNENYKPRKYSWGGGIAVGSILGGYLGYKIGRARPQKFGFETEKQIGQGIKKTFSKKKEMARGGGVSTSDLESLISEINESNDATFYLSGAYGEYELWGKDKNGGEHRIEVGSRKDIKEALIKNRYNEKYQKYANGGGVDEKIKSLESKNYNPNKEILKVIEKLIEIQWHSKGNQYDFYEKMINDLRTKLVHKDKFANGGGVDDEFTLRIDLEDFRYFDPAMYEASISVKNRKNDISKGQVIYTFFNKEDMQKAKNIYEEKFEKGGGVGMNDFGIGDKVMYDTFRDGTKEGEILREIDDNHWEIGSGFGVSMVNKDKVVGFAPKRRFGLFEEGGNIDDIVTG